MRARVLENLWICLFNLDTICVTYIYIESLLEFMNLFTQCFITFSIILFCRTAAFREQQLIIRLVKVKVSYNYTTNFGDTNNKHLYCSRFRVSLVQFDFRRFVW